MFQVTVIAIKPAHATEQLLPWTNVDSMEAALNMIQTTARTSEASLASGVFLEIQCAITAKNRKDV